MERVENIIGSIEPIFLLIAIITEFLNFFQTRKSSVKPYVIINAILVGASFFLLGAGSYLGIDIGR